MTITVKKAAREIDCSVSEVYRLITLGRLPVIKNEKGRIRIEEQAIVPFIGQIKNKPKSSRFARTTRNHSEAINLLKIARSSSSLSMVKSLINATLVLLK